MKIGIIGSGNIGGTLTKLFAQQGHEVAVANSRGPDTLGDLAAEAGERARAATVDDAAEFGGLVVVAVPLRAYRALPAGDDEAAKRKVAGLIDDIGFAPVDTGGLADGGRRQQPGAPVYGATMKAPEAEAALGG